MLLLLASAPEISISNCTNLARRSIHSLRLCCGGSSSCNCATLGCLRCSGSWWLMTRSSYSFDDRSVPYKQNLWTPDQTPTRISWREWRGFRVWASTRRSKLRAFVPGFGHNNREATRIRSMLWSYQLSQPMFVRCLDVTLCVEPFHLLVFFPKVLLP